MKTATILAFVSMLALLTASAEARPTKFAECRNGKVIIWTLGKDGAYHSQSTNQSCNFKKDIVLSSSVHRSSATAQPVSPVLSANEWQNYYSQNKQAMTILEDDAITVTKKGNKAIADSIAAP
ncbi:MAG: hypothetical protein JNL32_02495 [Candidatus Kapabacteria bacterium]|nr:hypothetical protein [Candidatus Kapabacteria bacterium]